jgi:hypothetical protein
VIGVNYYFQTEKVIVADHPPGPAGEDDDGPGKTKRGGICISGGENYQGFVEVPNGLVAQLSPRRNGAAQTIEQLHGRTRNIGTQVRVPIRYLHRRVTG